MTPRLSIIHLARRPLPGTVAEGAREHGTGGLNINGCRIRATPEDQAVMLKMSSGFVGRHMGRPELMNYGYEASMPLKTLSTLHTAGRWPANLILSHLDSCRMVGTKTVRGVGHYPASRPQGSGLAGAAGHSGQDSLPEVHLTEETVADWDCAPGCPCLDLDAQSGIRPVSGAAKTGRPSTAKGKPGAVFNMTRTGNGALHNDSGGASRFFKQVTTMTGLHEYLRTMISPPLAAQKPVAEVLTSWSEELDLREKGSSTGFIIHGFVPSEEQAAILFDLLCPGGHICLVAPDEQPTGHTGAIRLEDAGFEIRDAILWVRGPGRLHYVPKAGRKEREAGCRKLPAKKGSEAVDREEGSAGTRSPRAGAGRTAAKVRNFHPCVKPIALMVRLLQDVPTDQGDVVEPFLGSGTTLVACRLTGHSATGIERDAEYLPISDARVRHWDRDTVYPREGARIVSDLHPAKEAPHEHDLDIFDLLQ